MSHHVLAIIRRGKTLKESKEQCRATMDRYNLDTYFNYLIPVTTIMPISQSSQSSITTISTIITIITNPVDSPRVYFNSPRKRTTRRRASSRTSSSFPPRLWLAPGTMPEVFLEIVAPPFSAIDSHFWTKPSLST